MKIKHDAQGPRTVHECDECQNYPTPRPWRIENCDTDNYICGANGRFVVNLIGSPDAEDKANAAFIIRAVNSYDKMLAALKWVAEFTDGYHDHPDDAPEWVKEVHRAIAKAEVR